MDQAMGPLSIVKVDERLVKSLKGVSRWIEGKNRYRTGLKNLPCSVLELVPSQVKHLDARAKRLLNSYLLARARSFNVIGCWNICERC